MTKNLGEVRITGLANSTVSLKNALLALSSVSNHMSRADDGCS